MMLSIPTCGFIFLGLIQGMACGGVDSILNSLGLFGGFESIQGTENHAEELSKTLSDQAQLDEMYTKYQNAFGKMGSEDNNSNRKDAFKANLMKIANHNTNARAGKASYEMGVNQFTDMTAEEMASTSMGYMESPAPGNSKASTMPACSNTTPPDSMDWRDYGGVSSVKDQERCGSCCLFATTGCLESYQALTADQTGPIDLSEQELLDCANGKEYPGNHGCNGNKFEPTFDYLMNVGVPLAKDYPYTNMAGKCKAKSHPSVAKVKSYWDVAKNDEDAMKTAIAKFGPITVGICVTPSFKHYHSGIYSGPCDGKKNHAVLLVGYGTENNVDYWILKNQWKTTWGEKGYMRLARNLKMCSVSDHPMSCSDQEIIPVVN